MLRSRSKKDNQVISAVATAIDRYLTFAIDQETVNYFLVLHEMQLLSKKVQKPDVDRWIEGHPAQSAYEKL